MGEALGRYGIALLGGFLIPLDGLRAAVHLLAIHPLYVEYHTAVVARGDAEGRHEQKQVGSMVVSGDVGGRPNIRWVVLMHNILNILGEYCTYSCTAF